MSETKRVIACIPHSLWKEAQFNDVSWSDAIVTGIKMKLGAQHRIEDIRKKLDEIGMQAQYYKDRIKELEKDEQLKNKDSERNKKLKEEYEKFLKDNHALLKIAHSKYIKHNITDIGGLYEYWNQLNHKHKEIFGNSLDQNKFMQLVKEFK